MKFTSRGINLYFLPFVFSFLMLAGVVLSGGALAKSDFREYYSAFVLFFNDHNPYDASELLKIQQQLGNPFPTPLMMWNPPWLLVIFSPILILNYVTAFYSFQILSILSYFLSIYLVLRVEKERYKEREFILLFPVVITFLPFLACIYCGQVGCFLSLAIAVLYCGLKKSNDMMVALSLIFLTIKPHLFLLLFIYVCFFIIDKRRFKVLLYAASVFSLIIFLTHFLNKEVILNWIHASLYGVGAGLAPNKYDHNTTTLVSFIRSILSQDGTIYPTWPMYLVPGLGICVYLYRICLMRIERSMEKEFPVALVLSFLFTPFGWIFDYVGVIPFLVLVMIREIEQKRKEVYYLNLLLLFSYFSLTILGIGIGLEDYLFYLFGIFGLILH